MTSSENPPLLPTQSALIDVLRDSIQEVFSAMFISIESAARPLEGAGKEIPVDQRVDLEVFVEFRGALDGCVVLRCSNQGAEDIARGFLMLEEGDALEIEEVKDALGECANMVTGLVKSKALDPISDFAMGIPDVRGPEHAVKHEDAALIYKLSRGYMSAELWVSAA